MSGSQNLLLGGSPQAVPVDPFFYSVTSLLHGDGTNGGQNNTFLDSSTNNFSITRNGNTTQGSFSPFSQTGWGVYQPSTASDYVNFTTSAGTLFQFTGDYTIETWVFPTVLGSDTSIWITNDGSANYHAINIDATNYNIYLNSGTATSSFAHGLQLNQWSHVAMVRSGSTITVYTNGIARGTITNSSTNGYASPVLARIGGGVAGSSRYLSNLRIVKGTAVYTAAFTPPTTPLTAISGTSLLTCQANRFLDASSNALVATVTGSPSVQPFSPFNPTTAYSTSAVGGSGYFDGSGDYLSIARNNAFFPVANEDFTFEAWVYLTATPSAQGATIVGTGEYGLDSDWNLSVNSSLQAYLYLSAPNLLCTNTTRALNLNAWNHVAASRSGTSSNNIKVFVNGVGQSFSSNSTTVGSGNRDLTIGADQNGDEAVLTGYISSLRLVKGTAVYTADFTPPTAPLTAITNTSLLCNFTNAAIFDNAADADYETVGNAQISTSVKKYGTGSIAFDGSGDRLVGAPIQTRAPGTGDFCYEFWFYANTSSNACLFDTRAVNNNTTGFACLLNGSSQIALYTDTTILTCGLALSASTWYHIAVTRTAGVIKVFVNGTVVGTLANTSNFSDRTLQLGQYIDSTGSLNGYIDDFRSSNGVGRYAYNFTPPTAEFPNIGGTVTLTADPYFDYTTLLLPGNGTNGAQNNTFLDSSTNAFSITRNGNTTQGTFSPFSQTGWGNYFDGTGDALTVADNAALDMGSSDFTIECWAYLTTTGSDYGIVSKWNQWGTAGTNSYLLYYSSAGNLEFLVSTGGTIGDIVLSSAATLRNTWVHIAAVRSGSNFALFANGTRLATASSASSVYDSTQLLRIGEIRSSVANFPGYLSNVRIVKGTAVYDPTQASITVPTAPLTAITNTQLLTCQSNRFIDNSTNAFAITRNGDVSVQAFSPFNPTAAWSAATYGGSGYFDGSGDYVSAATASALQLTNAVAWTIEFWFYANAMSSQQFLLHGYDPNPPYTGYGIGLGTNGNPNTTLAFWDGTTWRTIATGLTPSQWYHVAISYEGSGTTGRMFLNGTQQGSAFAPASTINNTSNAIAWGAQNNNILHLNGYISGARIVKGTAVYTASFTAPTAPPTAITNTSLLLNFTNAGIYDATSKNDLETVGNAQISTTQSKFGGSSMYFDGTGDFTATPASENLRLGSGDFTVECWVYFNTLDANTTVMRLASGNGVDGILFCHQSNGGVYATSNGSTWDIINGSTFTGITTGTWTHLALTRYGNTFRGFVNGVVTFTVTSSSSIYQSSPIARIGCANSDGTIAMNGYVDDLRITKGIARYTSNFTPPTTAFLTL